MYEPSIISSRMRLSVGHCARRMPPACAVAEGAAIRHLPRRSRARGVSALPGVVTHLVDAEDALERLVEVLLVTVAVAGDVAADLRRGRAGKRVSCARQRASQGLDGEACKKPTCCWIGVAWVSRAATASA